MCPRLTMLTRRQSLCLTVALERVRVQTAAGPSGAMLWYSVESRCWPRDGALNRDYIPAVRWPSPFVPLLLPGRNSAVVRFRTSCDDRGSAAPPRLDSRPSSACRGGNPPHQPCFLASGEGGVGGDQQGLAAGRSGWVRHRPLVPAPICAESGERTTPPAGRPVWQWVGRLAQEAEL